MRPTEGEEAQPGSSTCSLGRQEAAVKTAPKRTAPAAAAAAPAEAPVAAPVQEPSLFKGLIKSLVGLFAGETKEPQATAEVEKKPASPRPQRNDERRSGRQQNRRPDSRGGRDEEPTPRIGGAACRERGWSYG